MIVGDKPNLDAIRIHCHTSTLSKNFVTSIEPPTMASPVGQACMSPISLSIAWLSCRPRIPPQRSALAHASVQSRKFLTTADAHSPHANADTEIGRIAPVGSPGLGIIETIEGPVWIFSVFSRQCCRAKGYLEVPSDFCSSRSVFKQSQRFQKSGHSRHLVKKWQI